MKIDAIIEQGVKMLDYPPEFINKVYRAYWKGVREILAEMNLKDGSMLKEEDFRKGRNSISIPSIGKFFVKYERYKYLNTHFRNEYKEDKADV